MAVVKRAVSIARRMAPSDEALFIASLSLRFGLLALGAGALILAPHTVLVVTQGVAMSLGVAVGASGIPPGAILAVLGGAVIGWVVALFIVTTTGRR